MSIQDAYNEWSRTYDTDRNLTRDLNQQVMVETLANLQFVSVLKTGCGTGKKAVFDHGEGAMEIPAFVHHTSDFLNAASNSGLKLAKLNERWHPQDQNKPPRTISFLFEKEWVE